MQESRTYVKLQLQKFHALQLLWIMPQRTEAHH